jgi:hypothetical protein
MGGTKARIWGALRAVLGGGNGSRMIPVHELPTRVGNNGSVLSLSKASGITDCG